MSQNTNKKDSSNQALNLVWIRRDLRVEDHAAFSYAAQTGGSVLPVFVFDSDILARFTNKNDRRLSFIADALFEIQNKIEAHGGHLLILHGTAEELIPALAKELGVKQVMCAADYEPETRKRDASVKKQLSAIGCDFIALCDDLIFPPQTITKEDGNPYKVYTPYSKAWKNKLHAKSAEERKVDIKNIQWSKKFPVNLPTIDLQQGVEYLLKKIGYHYDASASWNAKDGHKKLERFIAKKINNYHHSRDILAEEDGTSHISPYLRFGLISIRECVRAALHAIESGAGKGAETWLNELIWREFYAMILYHAPESASQEWNEKYRGIAWEKNEKLWQAFIESRTGYPLVDAAMRQLHEIGWMHNRARMIVASFLTKDLLLDWRLGEEHFAQYLMDYEMASNVGGWQWAASTGTDAQPWFRIFNPTTQSERFDPQGLYIKRYMPELKNIPVEEIHAPSGLFRSNNYPAPIVDHKQSRELALRMFKERN